MMEKLGKYGLNFKTADSIRDPQVAWLMLTEGAKGLWQDGFHQARLKSAIDRHGWPGDRALGSIPGGVRRKRPGSRLSAIGGKRQRCCAKSNVEIHVRLGTIGKIGRTPPPTTSHVGASNIAG